jgi:hypothetical protein
MISNQQPSITTGLRELCRSGSYSPNLTSGLYGGAVANPINVFKMIACFMTKTTTLPFLVL